MPTLADFRFSRSARRTLAALAPIVLSDEVEQLGLVEAVLDDLELLLRALPAPARAGLLAGVATFEHTARAAPSSLGRGFSRLPRPKAQAHFERWLHAPGPTKQLVKGLKMLLTFVYYEQPQVRARLGYTPDDWIARVTRERTERFGDALREAEARVTDPYPLVRRTARRRRARGLPRA